MAHGSRSYCPSVPRALLGALLLLAVGGGCSQRPPLRIVIAPGPTAALLVTAKARGFFVGQATSTRLIVRRSPAAARGAFAHGKAEGLAGTLADVLAVIGTSRHRPRIVLVTAVSGEQADVLAFEAGAIRARAGEIAAIVRAVEEARRWALANPGKIEDLARGQRVSAGGAGGRGTWVVAMVPALPEQRAYLAPGGGLERLGMRLHASMQGATLGRAAGPRLVLDLAAPEVVELAEGL